MDQIYSYIAENFGTSVLIIGILSGAVVSATIWLTVWITKIVRKNKEVERRINDLPCAAHNSSIESHASQIAENRERFARIEAQLDLLIAAFTPKPGMVRAAASPSLVRKKSPRALTADGESLLRDSGGLDFVDSHADYFISKIEALNPKTALDVEDMALMQLLIARSMDIFIPIKSWVYNSPVRKTVDDNGQATSYEPTLEDVIYVMSLPLRDKYLEKHPEVVR